VKNQKLIQLLKEQLCKEVLEQLIEKNYGIVHLRFKYIRLIKRGNLNWLDGRTEKEVRLENRLAERLAERLFTQPIKNIKLVRTYKFLDKQLESDRLIGNRDMTLGLYDKASIKSAALGVL